LVATLSITALLTLLVLALLGLAAGSTRISRQEITLAKAQANARLSMVLAIGQLQKELGSDQRISAPHGLAGGDPGGRPNWTGVYDAWTEPANDAPDTPDSRQVRFRNWLVSGGMGTGGEEIQLVGPGTLGPSAPATAQVSVPSMPFQRLNENGGVAWWVSDEGMKAKINAGPDTGSPATINNPLFLTQAARNPDQRAFSVLRNFAWQPGQRQNALTVGQVNLAAGLGGAGVGVSFHDLTVYGAGVLADVRAGRLRWDLSQLLSRPIAELEDKPLYVSDGRVNRFSIDANGALTNKSFVGSANASRYTGGEWGINLEELAIFHNIHREIDWSGGVPSLVTKNTVDGLALDRYHLYQRHVLEAMQFIFSLQAVRNGGPSTAPLYKMQLMLDGMVALSNPNDVRLRFPAGLVRYVDLQGMPYDARLRVTKASGVFEVTTVPLSNSTLFNGYIEGGFGGTPAGGFDLEPGEAAVFGSTTATGANLNLRRGFNPSGGVTMSWNLAGPAPGRAQFENLTPNDQIDFEFVKNTTPRNTGNSNTYFQAWHGAPGTPGRRIFESANLTAGNHTDPILNEFLPPKITSPQVLRVSDFIVSGPNQRPKPIMLFSIIRNVEQNSGGSYPDAMPSRPILLGDPAMGSIPLFPSTIRDDLHRTQMMFAAKPLNYRFETFATGPGGRNVYQGGGRQPGNVGGEFTMIKRRIPLAPPISLGAFENAVAGGFWAHYGDPAFPSAWNTIGASVDPTKTGLNSSLSNGSFGYPFLAKAIGNSFTHPFIAPDRIHRPGTGTGTRSRSATDPSWLVNTALWDSWFLSGIVDGSGTSSSSPMKDLRTARAQFKDLAEGTGMLRNTRYRFHPYGSLQTALAELFTGEQFKRDALNKLGKYLLIDGAFNVNSTSVEAWAAMFRSVAGQEVLNLGKKFNHPYGTIGYGVNDATSGSSGDWSGLRDLTEDQIRTLAEKTVDEVKARGPFLSMADFVNRRPNASAPGHQVLGALQAAIDKSGLNDRFSGAGRGLTAADFQPLAGKDSVDSEPAAARSVGAPGHLRQAGILTALGSQISPRSDTFVIRAYGDHRDRTGTKVQSRAYCEAVVQRVPEFVDPGDAPEATPVSAVNRAFGRQFRIVSFRWLNAEEI
jgi:hypothetical protein